MWSRWSKLIVLACLGASALVVSSQAAADRPDDAGRADTVAAYWTPERIASAQPRDLVVDENGQGFLRRPDGSLEPRGHTNDVRLEQVDRAASPGVPTAKAPNARPSGGGGDSTPPLITLPTPDDGDLVTATTEDPIDFSATIEDNSGIRSVTVVIHFPSGSTQSFTGTSLGNDVWGTTLSGFTPDPNWGWEIVAKDASGGRGNTARGGVYGFTVEADGGTGTDPGTGGDPNVVTNERWTTQGGVTRAAGRILFEMPTEVRRGRRTTIQWQAYVCSGTTVTDGRDDASIILTAAHCVYDDALDMFARNVLFIPNQDDGGTDRTDSDCTNDPLGCWAPSSAAVHAGYTATTFPGNNAWDYGYYVVPNTGAHSGETTIDPSLEANVDELTIGFNSGAIDQTTHALGYSYDDDPLFMYCAESMEMIDGDVNWWLPSCGLTGGSSGGPWVQPMEATGTGSIISVNSWGYTTQPGMAGPKLGPEAECTFAAANTASLGATGDPQLIAGVVADCP